MDKVERQLLADYIYTHDTDDILKNQEKIESLLTTTQLKNSFKDIVKQLEPQDISLDDIPEFTPNFTNNLETQQQEVYAYINQSGEILRSKKPLDDPNHLLTQVAGPNLESNEPKKVSINEYDKITQTHETQNNDNPVQNTTHPSINKDGKLVGIKTTTQEANLTFKQKIALFLQKHNLFKNFTFVDNFIKQQLDVLPEGRSEIIEQNTFKQEPSNINYIDRNTEREAFLNSLSCEKNIKPLSKEKLEAVENYKKTKKQIEQEKNDYER